MSELDASLAAEKVFAVLLLLVVVFCVVVVVWVVGEFWGYPLLWDG